MFNHMVIPHTGWKQGLDFALLFLAWIKDRRYLQQNIQHYSVTSHFLGQLLSSSFQWQRSCDNPTVSLYALGRATTVHAPHTSQSFCWCSVYTQTHVNQKAWLCTTLSEDKIHLWENCFRVIFPFHAKLPVCELVVLALQGRADLGFVYRKSKWHTNFEVAFGHLTATPSSYLVLKHFLVCKPRLSFLYHRNKVFINKTTTTKNLPTPSSL